MTTHEIHGSAVPDLAPDVTQRLDLGRLVGVPVMTGLLLLNASGVVREVSTGGPWTVGRAVALAARLLTVALYVLFVAAFLRRTRARASHPSRSAAVAAGLATWLPFALPLLPANRPSLATLTVSNVLLVLGLGFAVWSLRYLDRSFSMVAQARRVVRTGPYAVVRHPLYTGELVALLGTVLSRPAWTTFAVWVAILSLQLYRATHEEEILAAVLPDYREYQRQTPQLVPLAVSRVWRRGGTAAH